MEALDGNAIAGLLHEVFAHEMTTARGSARTAAMAVAGRVPGVRPRRPALSSAAGPVTPCSP